MEEYRFCRSKYCEGMRLAAADLQNQQDYDCKKRELLLRFFCGPGIVRGFSVENLAERKELLIRAGLALDPQGRTLFLPENLRVPYARLFQQAPTYGNNWKLCIGYTERASGEGRMLQPDGIHLAVQNRVEEGVRFSARLNPQEDELVIATLTAGIQEEKPFIWDVRPEKSRLFLESFKKMGTDVLRLPISERLPGNLLYSQEVSHGLGSGNVRVELALEGWQGGRQCVISGAAGLFRLDLEMGVKLFPDTGTFLAAVRVPDGWDRDIRLRWYAERCEPSCVADPFQPVELQMVGR